MSLRASATPATSPRLRGAKQSSTFKTTGFIEQGHGFGHRFEPLTVCSYDVDVSGVVDLRTDVARDRAGVALAEMNCAWALDLASQKRPASWAVAERLIAGKASGVLVPSFARGARADIVNLVLWRWGPKRPHKVTVHDPSGRLRKLRSAS